MFPSILIVDDEASILKSLSGILSDEGFETIIAKNGYEALKILESESPDLVLLDIAASMSEATSEILDDTLNIKPTAYLPHTDQLITLIVTNDWHFNGVAKCQ